MRGGKRIKKKYQTPQAALLDAIWKTFGGISKVARLLGEDKQCLINWRNRGHVPLVKVKRLSELLGLPEEAFNYKDVVKFYGGSSYTWKSLVHTAVGKNSMYAKQILSNDYDN